MDSNYREISGNKQYAVPAIEKAHRILALIAEQPAKLRMIDISRMTGFNKSNVFSLLKTMHNLGWVRKSELNTFEIGETLALYGASHLFQFELVEKFHIEVHEALAAAGCEQATFQLAILDGLSVLYLAKAESRHALKIPSFPGLRLPAHCTAMGKVMLSQYTREELDKLYPSGLLERITQNTAGSVEELYAQIIEFRRHDFLLEVGEARSGYSCIAAPIRNFIGRICAAISLTVLEPYPSPVHESGIKVICNLAERITNAIGQS